MTGSKSLMFGIELLATFHLRFVACRPIVFNAAVDICAGIDVVVKVVREGLINLLVAVATATSLGAWRLYVVA